MMMTVPCNQQSFTRLAETFWKKYVLDYMYSPFTKITYRVTSPLPPWSSFSELSEVLSPGLQFSFAPNKTSLTTLTLCIFFFSQLYNSVEHEKFTKEDIYQIINKFSVNFKGLYINTYILNCNIKFKMYNNKIARKTKIFGN